MASSECYGLGMRQLSGVSTITATTQPEIIKESRIQPVWHVIVLNVLTVCLYLPVWFYITAHQLARRYDGAENPGHEPLTQLTLTEKNSLELTKRIPPLMWALGMPIPFINIILGIFFFKMIAELYPERSSFISRQPLLIGSAVTVSMIALMCLGKLPNNYYLLYVTACLPAAISQHWLNKYWHSVEPEGLLVRQSFATGELVMLILGIGLLGLILATFFIVPH
jgi:uncharacterized BrkB/YihY/UPF0761 family membrane protein